MIDANRKRGLAPRQELPEITGTGDEMVHVTLSPLLKSEEPITGNEFGIAQRFVTAKWFTRAVWLTTTLCCFSYPLAMIGIWILLRLCGDGNGLATLLLFGPRWVYVLPVMLLLPVAFLNPRCWLPPIMIGAMIAIGPIMGFNLGWRAWASGVAAGQPTVRVLTYNIGWKVNEAAFAEMLDRFRPQLVALQEIPNHKWHIPEGWYVERQGELVVTSRFPIVRTEVSANRWSRRKHPEVNAIYCVVNMPQGNIGFCNVHLDTPRSALDQILHPRKIIDFSQVELAEQMIEKRRRESADLAVWLAKFPEPKIIAGDFNMPCDSTIYRTYWSGREDSFQQAGFGFGYTKQTTKKFVTFGTRIDHILADPGWTAMRCWQGHDFGSDHLPLIAVLAETK